jgi:hypothetical protein
VYGWLWRHLPGPLPVRLVLAVFVAAAVVALLALVIFPHLEPLVPGQDVTVGSSSG